VLSHLNACFLGVHIPPNPSQVIKPYDCDVEQLPTGDHELPTVITLASTVGSILVMIAARHGAVTASESKTRRAKCCHIHRICKIDDARQRSESGRDAVHVRLTPLYGFC
jgi:hypothetical protein